MHCFAQTLELKDNPKLIAEYLTYHEKVWPEVMQAIQSMGVSNMKIFIHGNRLFMYAEAGDDFDPSKDYQKYTQRCPNMVGTRLTRILFQSGSGPIRIGIWILYMSLLSPKAREWDELMRKYQQKVPAASEDSAEWWSPMTLCFDLKTKMETLS